MTPLPLTVYFVSLSLLLFFVLASVQGDIYPVFFYSLTEKEGFWFPAITPPRTGFLSLGQKSVEFLWNEKTEALRNLPLQKASLGPYFELSAFYAFT